MSRRRSSATSRRRSGSSGAEGRLRSLVRACVGIRGECCRSKPGWSPAIPVAARRSDVAGRFAAARRQRCTALVGAVASDGLRLGSPRSSAAGRWTLHRRRRERGGPRVLRPGEDSDRHVRVVVDDHLLWEGSGPPLMGTVTVTGRPAPCVEVIGPSMPHF